MTTKQSSNVYIFYGEDDFSLAKKIERWKEEFVKKFSNQGVTLLDKETLGYEAFMKNLEQAAMPSLFSSKRLVICKEGLPDKAGQEDLADFIDKLATESSADSFFIFYTLKNPDKRLASVKQIFKSKANFTEFSLPHGINLNGWIKAYAALLNVAMDSAAIEKLAVYLGRDLYQEKKFGGKVVERKEVFDLWQAHSELLKLSNYSSKITSDIVQELVMPKISENIFELADNITKKNKGRALNLLENLFADQSSDEKSIAIKTVGLLAEQVRALLLATLLKNQNLNNEQIADALGWSSGRVFMVTKQAGGVDVEMLKRMMNDLLQIDSSLKSSDTNPKLLIDMFIAKFA